MKYTLIDKKGRYYGILADYLKERDVIFLRCYKKDGLYFYLQCNEQDLTPIRLVFPDIIIK
jgi:hypothetical protein